MGFGTLHSTNPERLMSALGQKQTLQSVNSVAECPLCAKSRHAVAVDDGKALGRAASLRSLSALWPAQSEITLGAEDIAVKARDPLPPPRGHIQVLNGGLDMWRNAVPKELRV